MHSVQFIFLKVTKKTKRNKDNVIMAKSYKESWVTKKREVKIKNNDLAWVKLNHVYYILIHSFIWVILETRNIS